MLIFLRLGPPLLPYSEIGKLWRQLKSNIKYPLAMAKLKKRMGNSLF